MSATKARLGHGSVLFDLDGTLINSAPDLAAAVNELLGSQWPRTADARRRWTSMIGNGVEKLSRTRHRSERPEALGPEALKREQYEAMIGIYAEASDRP